MNAIRSIGFLVLVLFVTPGAVVSQERADTIRVRADTAEQQGIRPRDAFLRSLVVPGWGQASARAYTRGGVFFAIQASSWYMLLRTHARLELARDLEARRVTFAEDSIRATGDTVNLRARVDSVPRVREMRALIESRERHQQDWITYTLFFTLASGLDALIAAHLADFPAAITVRPQENGAFQLRVGVPLRRRL